MTDFWQEQYLVKRREPAIRWYTMDNVIHIVASDGNMRREAIDSWAETIRDVIDAVEPDAPLFIIVDLSNPKQGFTPYSGGVTRDLLQYVTTKRNAKSYIGMVLSNNIINQMISTFFQQILTRTNYPRRTFLKSDNALAWMREQVKVEETSP